MAAALLTFLAEEMWTEAKDVQDSNKRPRKENSKYHAQTITNKTKDTEIEDTENITRVRRSNKVETHERRYKWMYDNNSRQMKTKDKTGKKGKLCFDNILVDCRGILFGKL